MVKMLAKDMPFMRS